MKSILDETQLERDKELARLTATPLSDIQQYKIASPRSIKIYGGSKHNLDKKELEHIYQKYDYLILVDYYRTLMYTSVARRHPELIKLLRETKNKICLDFGSGVGTHAIALLENNNKVTILDVKESPLLTFAENRILARGFNVEVVTHKTSLLSNYYDVIICTDVLEHVYDPIVELNKIITTLKFGGLLHLQISNMIKPSSGHFCSSINKWKQNGQKNLTKYFTKISKTIYRKNDKF